MTDAAINLPSTGFVREAQLIPGIIPFSHSTLWRRVNDGTFPKPVKLSAKVTAWRCNEIHAWIAAQGRYEQPPTAPVRRREAVAA